MKIFFIQDQRTPLHYASKEGNSEVVEELLTRSTRPNVVDKVSEITKLLA